MKDRTVNRLCWAIVVLCALVLGFAMWNGRQASKECVKRGGKPIIIARNLYPLCFNKEALK